MGFRVNTNMAAISGVNNLKRTTLAQTDSNMRLSSGSRINKSADDAAGLAISEKMKSHIRSAKQAGRNANDGISMIQVAEGGLNESSNILNRLRELAIQASSDTVGDIERGYVDKEYQQLKSELQRIAEVTDFNGVKLLNGEGGKLDFQIGMNNDNFRDRISYDASDNNVTLDSLGVSEIEVMSKEGAQESLAKIDEAINKIASNRSSLGAIQNRLTSTINNIDTMTENLSAANSRIRDLDYAVESSENARLNLLQNSGTSVLAQANASGNSVMKLIG